MFVKTSQQLTNAINHILEIYNRLVIWHGFAGVSGEASTLERSDNRDEERIGAYSFIGRMTLDPNVYPFQTGTTASSPPLIPSLTICGYSLSNDGLMVQQEMSTSKPVLMARRATMPETMTPTTSNVGTSYAMSIKKGKKKVMSGELGAVAKEVVSQQDVNKDGESEVGEKDIEMAEDISEPVWGRSKKRARSHSESWPQSRWRSQLWAMQWGMKDVEGHGEGMPTPSNPPTSPKPKYGLAQLATRTTPPPNPEACEPPPRKKTCISQGGQASQSRAAASSSSAPLLSHHSSTHTGHTLAILPDCMQVLEQELADCWWNVTTLTHEMETLRHRPQGWPLPMKISLIFLDHPTIILLWIEAEESIAVELHGLVLMATLSTHNISTNQPIQEGSMMGTPVEEESGSVVVGNQSGVMSAQNDEEDMTEWHCAVGQLQGQHLWNIHGW
ncbi:hypothetical protein EDC04DRAFT_2612961 [Pisolithus marmoratus]|nr:hypothetical protein EDC04DRAFT_2612961 [Pisolithus marmoratus]